MRTGYRLALAIAAITLLLAAALAALELLSSGRDADAYGSMALPGRESISLPAGDVIVYYGVRSGESDIAVAVPPNLRLRVRTIRGQLLGSTPYRFNQFSDGDYVRRSVGTLEVPEAGPYEAVSSTRVPGAANPMISFGRGGNRTFGYVFFVLAGGLLLAAVLSVVIRLSERLEAS